MPIVREVLSEVRPSERASAPLPEQLSGVPAGAPLSVLPPEHLLEAPVRAASVVLIVAGGGDTSPRGASPSHDFLSVDGTASRRFLIRFHGGDRRLRGVIQ